LFFLLSFLAGCDIILVHCHSCALHPTHLIAFLLLFNLLHSWSYLSRCAIVFLIVFLFSSSYSSHHSSMHWSIFLIFCLCSCIPIHSIITLIRVVCVKCYVQTFSFTLLSLSCVPLQKIVLLRNIPLVGKTKQEYILLKLVDCVSTTSFDF
jgi:hypothetical protein